MAQAAWKPKANDNGRRFIVRLRPDPFGPDHMDRTPEYRLKLALKRLARDFGLRAQSVEDVVAAASRRETSE